MTKLEQIEKFIAELPPEDVARLRAWLDAYAEEMWDRQIERDVKAGKLDKLVENARADLKFRRFRDI